MPLSNICEKYRKLVILLAAAKFEPYIFLRQFFISEHILIGTPTYLKIKIIHDINFLDVKILSHSYRQWLLS